MSVAQQQLGKSLVYARDTDPLVRGRTAAAGYVLRARVHQGRGHAQLE
ncbi:MAG: hypothetical protein M3547_04060 [Acidobacteriota bacterium]|nr:hypothetical protein [Acidobacteriota bacterium]